MLTVPSAIPPAARIDAQYSHDIHEQATLLDNWNQEYCQVSKGAFDGSVISVRAEGLRIFVERMNRAVLQKGDVARNRIGFGIPLSLSGKSVLCGEESHLDGLHVFSGSSGFEYLSPEKLIFIGLEMTVPDATSSGEEVMLVRELQRALRQGRRVIPLDTAYARNFGLSLMAMFDGLRSDPIVLDNPHSVSALKRASAGAALELLSHRGEQTHPQAMTIANNWRLASQARALIEESPDCPMSIVEVAIRLGVSRRTLQYACQRALDLNPTAYLRAIRLSRARMEMQHARSVTEAATRWGFCHFGYFARDYRQMFGELPSDTLKRAQAN
ncbi:MAG: helix-turn-helix domain-containing protein [Alphaproteobacteria bacterium]|nr:helix-turn-helix domain-containing protein [Alphaproteobacteria bacterium]